MAYKNNKVILLTTKTTHHEHLIKVLESNKNINLSIVFENKKNKAKYKIGSLYKRLELKFERRKFLNNKKYKIQSPIYNFNSINSPNCIKTIKKIKANTGIIFGTGKVSEKIIKILKNKLINIHRGMIQSYRGLDSEFWACYHKDFKSIGTTIHYANKYLDKGQIIYEKNLKLKKNMKAYQLRYYTTLIASKKINKILINLIKNKKMKKINQIHGRYYSFIHLDLKKIAYKNFDEFCKKIK